jgi:hypothetical protein
MVDLEQLAIRLGHVEHFRSLKPDELRSIVDSGRIQRFTAGEVIFVEEEPSAGLFVLLSGRVQFPFLRFLSRSLCSTKFPLWMVPPTLQL